MTEAGFKYYLKLHLNPHFQMQIAVMFSDLVPQVRIAWHSLVVLFEYLLFLASLKVCDLCLGICTCNHHFSGACTVSSCVVWD